jgi:ribulose 1,5-bisphosphate synthetase/thiazole synthase
MRNKSTRRRFLYTASRAIAGGAVLAAAPVTARGQSGASPSILSRRPLLAEVDVLVVGGGPAGIGAALSAARHGAQTLLIENHSFFGGVAAWSMGMQMNQMRPGSKPRSQIHELLIEKLKAYGAQAVRLGQHEVWCNVEYLKVAVLDALDAAGCRYFVHVRAADAIVAGSRVTGAVVATKAGLQSIHAKVVVDCTGDADVAFYAGAETMVQADTLMPMTLGLTLTNIDKTQVRPADLERVMHQARGKLPLIPSGFIEVKQVAESTSWWVNHAGRRQALQMVQALRDSDQPALRQIEWSGAGPQVSVRESRRVKGAYVLTEDDAMAGRSFEDVIAWRSGFLDLGGQKNGKYIKMQVHDVPYRAILPEKLDGLLTAGRCISATHAGAAAGKSMGNCMATGHAAGVAAALSVKQDSLPRALKVSDIQAALRADGVNLKAEERDQAWLK